MSKISDKYILDFIIGLLHPEKNEVTNSFYQNQSFWNRFVEIASIHLVIPAIYYSIKKKKIDKYFPKELINYLKKIHKLNYDRNCQILNQLDFLAKLFKENEIDYIFLKGSALIVSPQFDAKNFRMVGDIDVLVAHDDLLKSQTILSNIGFNEINDEIELRNGIHNVEHRHLKRLVHKDYIAAIEIHRELFDKKNKLRNIQSYALFNDKVKTKKGYLIPSKIHLWHHAILNWQINDSGINLNYLSLKVVVDAFYLEPDNLKENLNLYHKLIRHFYILISLHDDRYSKGFKLVKFHYLLQIKYRIFYKINKGYLRFIRFIMILVRRTILLLKSNKYRRNLIKNRKLIKRKILSIWKTPN